MLLKVCGVCGESAGRDIEMLAAAEVDLVGLWHGVRGGAAELSMGELVRLAAAAREKGVEPVLVTLEHEVSALAAVLRTSKMTWIQLHAYQLPSVVERLKVSLRHRVTIVKVLHVRGDRCVDLPLVRDYERAGADAFLLDVTNRDGQVGSTGESIPLPVASSVAGQLNRPFLLAGGISATSRWKYRELMGRARFAGVDVSTAARGADGRLCSRRIETIRRAWC
jgi:phosphoribosylanthranilate isomerase